MNKNILLCGVGGQGIVLTSKLTASCAMAKGMDVMSAETIGMAQKGGSVFSFLRLGEEIHSPMFGLKQADILIAFEPAEAVRMLPYLKDGGCAVVNMHPIKPVTASLKGSAYNGDEMTMFLAENVFETYFVDGDAMCRELGSPRVLNMVMLGQALRTGYLPFTANDAVEAMKKTVKPQFAKLNEVALRSSAG